MRVLVFAGDWACEIELRQTGVNCFPWRQRSWSCGVFKSWISDAHCPFQWKWQVLHNYNIFVLQQVGMFCRWDRLLDEGLAFVQAGVPSCPDDVTLRSCMHEFPMWPRRCKQIDPHWFQGRQCVSGEFYQSCRENSSWYIRADYLVQQIFNQSPPGSYFQQFTGSCYSLWITGNSLWHRD